VGTEDVGEARHAVVGEPGDQLCVLGECPLLPLDVRCGPDGRRKVDTMAPPELAQAFNVRSIPTLAIIRARVVVFAQPGGPCPRPRSGT
jgi:hypothetical protein